MPETFFLNFLHFPPTPTTLFSVSGFRRCACRHNVPCLLITYKSFWQLNGIKMLLSNQSTPPISPRKFFCEDILSITFPFCLSLGYHCKTWCVVLLLSRFQQQPPHPQLKFALITTFFCATYIFDD